MAGVIAAVIVTALVGFEIGQLYSATTSSTSGEYSSTVTMSSLSQLSTSNSTTGSNGVELSLSINSTLVRVGQSLEFNVTVYNTLDRLNSIPTSAHWLFRGIPVALWPDCLATNSDVVSNPGGNRTVYFLTTPADVAVLKGYYTIENISNIANVFIPSQLCYDGAGVMDHVIFQSESSIANVTGITDSLASPRPSNQTNGPYQLSNTYTATGYWNLTASAAQMNPAIIIAPGYTHPPSTTLFVPGVYTVAVDDEWGQSVLLHFEVDAAG